MRRIARRRRACARTRAASPVAGGLLQFTTAQSGVRPQPWRLRSLPALLLANSPRPLFNTRLVPHAVGQEYPSSPGSREDRRLRLTDQDPVLEPGTLENDWVHGGPQTVVAGVNRVVSRRAEKTGHLRREGIVDEESHAGWGIGISRSIAEIAAKRRQSRMSSTSRSG